MPVDEVGLMVDAACKIHGCRRRDLLHWRINDRGQMVLIVKPAGQKFIVDVPAPATFAEPATLPTFVEQVPKRLWVILEKHGLTDPDTLRLWTDEELLNLDGIGTSTLIQIREVLQQVA